MSFGYGNLGDAAESILFTTIELGPDWMQWRAAEPTVLLRPETDYEGARLPIAPPCWAPPRGRFTSCATRLSTRKGTGSTCSTRT